jgi:hypothetical protein
MKKTVRSLNVMTFPITVLARWNAFKRWNLYFESQLRGGFMSSFLRALLSCVVHVLRWTYPPFIHYYQMRKAWLQQLIWNFSKPKGLIQKEWRYLCVNESVGSLLHKQLSLTVGHLPWWKRNIGVDNFAAYLTNLHDAGAWDFAAVAELAKRREHRHPPSCSVAADRWPTSQRLRKL